MKKLIALLLAAFLLLGTLAGCTTREAQKVNHNMNVAADNFSCERRITVYNARTDKIILYAEGYMSISNNSASELVVTCKVGANEYKKNNTPEDLIKARVMYTIEEYTYASHQEELVR